MTAEVTAQLYAGILALSSFQEYAVGTPIDVYYDNEAAAAFARAVSESKQHTLLSACLGVTWQMVSMRRRVNWYHEYPHTGRALNELADSLVAHATFCSATRLVEPVQCCRWCKNYKPIAIKLLYLLHLPVEMQCLYPRVNESRTAIAATQPGTQKWGLDASTIGEIIDVIPEIRGK